MNKTLSILEFVKEFMIQLGTEYNKISDQYSFQLNRYLNNTDTASDIANNTDTTNDITNNSPRIKIDKKTQKYIQKISDNNDFITTQRINIETELKKFIKYIKQKEKEKEKEKQKEKDENSRETSTSSISNYIYDELFRLPPEMNEIFTKIKNKKNVIDTDYQTLGNYLKKIKIDELNFKNNNCNRIICTFYEFFKEFMDTKKVRF